LVTGPPTDVSTSGLTTLARPPLIWDVAEIAVVTGGTSGLGFALAEGVTRRGKRVALLARDPQRLDGAVAKLREGGASASGYRCDVSREGEVREALGRIAGQGTVRLLFNVAGVGRFGPPDAISDVTIDEVFAGNLKGLMLTTAAALPFLREAGGTIVSVLSTAALVGRRNESVYCAAKWGARGFMEALRAELEGTPIRTLTVYPGGMRSGFWSQGSGPSPDLTGYMDPDDVAAHILAAALDPRPAHVTEMTIRRPGP
jgi:short-subunit dehydrogenase